MKTKDITGLVKYVVAQLIKSGRLAHYESHDDDIVQEGYLAALETLARHEEAFALDEVAFSTLLLPRIRGAILDYVAKERNAGMASKRKQLDVVSLNADIEENEALEEYAAEAEAGSHLDAITYDDTLDGYTPIAYRDAASKLLVRELENLVDLMDEPYRSTLIRHYGLLGHPDMTFAEVEKALGISSGTSYKRLTEALNRLRNGV